MYCISVNHKNSDAFIREKYALNELEKKEFAIYQSNTEKYLDSIIKYIDKEVNWFWKKENHEDIYNEEREFQKWA